MLGGGGPAWVDWGVSEQQLTPRGGVLRSLAASQASRARPARGGAAACARARPAGAHHGSPPFTPRGENMTSTRAKKVSSGRVEVEGWGVGGGVRGAGAVEAPQSRSGSGGRVEVARGGAATRAAPRARRGPQKRGGACARAHPRSTRRSRRRASRAARRGGARPRGGPRRRRGPAEGGRRQRGRGGQGGGAPAGSRAGVEEGTGPGGAASLLPCAPTPRPSHTAPSPGPRTPAPPRPSRACRRGTGSGRRGPGPGRGRGRRARGGVAVAGGCRAPRRLNRSPSPLQSPQDPDLPRV
jgi:hypothetical protein